jgi:hypothetical protein
MVLQLEKEERHTNAQGGGREDVVHTLKIQEVTILSSPDFVLANNHSTGDCGEGKYLF